MVATSFSSRLFFLSSLSSPLFLSLSLFLLLSFLSLVILFSRSLFSLLSLLCCLLPSDSDPSQTRITSDSFSAPNPFSTDNREHSLHFFRLCPIVAAAVNVSPLLERILLLVDAVSSTRQPLHRCSAIFDTSIGLWERGDVLRCRYDGRIAEERIPRESVDAVVTLDSKKYLFERRTMALRESEDVCICSSLLIGFFLLGNCRVICGR